MVSGELDEEGGAAITGIPRQGGLGGRVEDNGKISASGFCRGGEEFGGEARGGGHGESFSSSGRRLRREFQGV